MAEEMIQGNVKILIDHVERDETTGCDQYFFFLSSFFKTSRSYECSLGMDFSAYRKVNFFLQKMLSLDVTGHSLQFYFDAFRKAVKEQDFSCNYFGRQMLSESGRLKPVDYLANKILEAPLFEEAKPSILNRIPAVETDNNLGRLVFEFYRFKCYSSIILMNRSIDKILAFTIKGDRTNEIIELFLHFNEFGQVIRMRTITKIGFDPEIARFACLHFKRTYLMGRFEFWLKPV